MTKETKENSTDPMSDVWSPNPVCSDAHANMSGTEEYDISEKTRGTSSPNMSPVSNRSSASLEVSIDMSGAEEDDTSEEDDDTFKETWSTSSSNSNMGDVVRIDPMNGVGNPNPVCSDAHANMSSTEAYTKYSNPSDVYVDMSNAEEDDISETGDGNNPNPDGTEVRIDMDDEEELSIEAWFARHTLMSTNLFTTIPSYFSPAEVGEMLAKALGWPDLESLLGELFGTSGVGGNIFLREINLYNFFEAYRQRILKDDRFLAFLAVNTAISDAAMATLLSDIIYTALNKGVIYFDFIGAVFGNFFVNYLSLINLEAHLSRDDDTLKKHSQLDAVAFYLLGRDKKEAIAMLSDLLCLPQDEMNINADADELTEDYINSKFKALLELCEKRAQEDAIQFNEQVKDYCESKGLWDGQSLGYKIVSWAGRICGALAAMSLFSNNFNLYHNDMHLPTAAAIPLSIVPLPPKGALYDRSWATLLTHLRHFPDSLRNAAFLVEKNPLYLAFLLPMSALGTYMIPSGAGFYLVGRGFQDFIGNKVFNMSDVPESGPLYDALWGYRATITMIGMMTNETAFLSAFSLLAGKVQDKLFPDENEAYKFFAKQAKKVLDENMPKETVMEKVSDSAAASTVKSWCCNAAFFCAQSPEESQRLYATGTAPAYGACNV